ncbi:hypothetical protein KM043_008536 [Ampulex compressa]|nr:hypothetical protein KM043_008536 [Ampulex compressa]
MLLKYPRNIPLVFIDTIDPIFDPSLDSLQDPRFRRLWSHYDRAELRFKRPPKSPVLPRLLLGNPKAYRADLTAILRQPDLRESRLRGKTRPPGRETRSCEVRLPNLRYDLTHFSEVKTKLETPTIRFRLSFPGEARDHEREFKVEKVLSTGLS